MSALPAAFRPLWSREQIAAAVDTVADRMVEAYREEPAVNLVPVMAGALPFAAALLGALERRATGKWLVAPVSASAYAADARVSEPVLEFPERFPRQVDVGVPAVIVDDLLDTGRTMAALGEALRARGFPQVDLCVLVDKTAARSVDVTPAFYGLRFAEDDWLVGFGMDHERRYRGLDAIYRLTAPS
jgi:hypoxanthine phosphoribosyltransferase